MHYLTRFKTAIGYLLAACILYATTISPVFAASGAAEPRPGIIEMTFDGLIARPVLFLVTVLGASVFVVTLPFSAAGGNVEEAKERLVMDQYRNTFQRCLGCMPKEQTL